MTKPTFDPLCLELASHFLEDDEAFFSNKSDPERKQIAENLASRIQSVCEDFVEEMHSRTYAEVEQPR